tara:strand:+ start:374 stop:706 length:333 start_codon:yes stop_codon:yes gene_type:complete
VFVSMGLCGKIEYYCYSRDVNRGKTQILSSFFLLMVLTTDSGWGIAPINGNPFIDKESCIETLTDVKRFHPTKLHNKYFLDLRCIERKTNYLERKNDEPFSQNTVTVDIF